MGIGAILGILFFVAALAGFVALGMNSEGLSFNFGKSPQKSEQISLAQIEQIKEDLLSSQNEEELTQKIQDLATTPEALDSCRGLFAEMEKAQNSIKSVDDTQGIKKFQKVADDFFNQSFCPHTQDLWMSP